jgi:hypothetical protein
MILNLLLGFLACTPEAAPTGTADVRVDHAKNAVESLGPRSCVQEEGILFTVWQDDRDGHQAIWFNMSADGGATFLASDTLLSLGEADASNPSIACTGDFVYVVWEDKRDGELGYENIYVQWSDDRGRHWQKEDRALDADPEGEAISLAPVVAAAGDNAWVVWSDSVNGAYDIYLTRTSSGGEGWENTPIRIDTDEAGAAYSGGPRVVGDGDGNVVVVWEDRRSGGTDIYANYSSNSGKSFESADTRLDSGDEAGASDSFLAGVAKSGDNVYAVWQDDRYGENSDILMSYSHNGGKGWADAPVRVESDAEGIADSINPTVAADGERVWVAFQDNRAGGGYDIFLRWSEDAGSSWANEEEVRMETDDPGEGQSYHPHIAVDGDMWAVQWEDYRDDLEGVGFNDLYYDYTVDGGVTWQASDVRINSTALATSYANEAAFFLRGGFVVTVWSDGRTGSSDIFAAGRAIGDESVWIEQDESAK